MMSQDFQNAELGISPATVFSSQISQLMRKENVIGTLCVHEENVVLLDLK